MQSSLTEWLLLHYGREEMKKETGLSRIREALSDLLPDLSKKKIITVAGTNGKGETTLWLSRELGSRKHCTQFLAWCKGASRSTLALRRLCCHFKAAW